MPATADVSTLSGHCLAGVVDAEGHFAVTEFNGGGSVSCQLVVAMRDDDIGLLDAMAKTTGLGVIRRKNERGNPQALWVVYRKDEAATLAAYLQEHPLRSRKRRDFEVWSAAVELWHSSRADRFDRMQELRHRIKQARRYRVPSAASAIDCAGFDDWLAGFLAGDGHLGVSAGGVRITVKLRADDAPLLAWIKETTGMGHIGGPYRNRAAHPSLAWNVTRTSDLVALADRLAGRIPGRKGQEFEVWRIAVNARADSGMPPVRRREIIDDAERQLQELRRYRPGASVRSAKSRRLQRMYDENQAWVALLRRWASEEPGPLAAMNYQRWRRAGSPTRNTLASRFGSWYDALDAAGLADRAALMRDERDARVRGGEDGRAARRLVQRERVIAAAERCANALGRFPGPTAYARWRIHNEPGAPSFVTAYRVFPGGWDQLRAACLASS